MPFAMIETTSRPSQNREWNPQRPGRWAGVLLSLVVGACARPLPPSTGASDEAVSAEALPSSTQLPVGQTDILWGEVNAPVTVVAFLDFECPFCARVHATLLHLLEKYGPEQVRLVVKHAPLPFHERGRPAALAAQVVYRVKGVDAFLRYAGELFDGVEKRQPDALSDARLTKLAEQVGVSAEVFARELARSEVSQKVNEDLALHERLGVGGVPAFFINGAELVGARPVGDFETLIDHELAATGELQRRGVASALVYERRVQVNFDAAPQAEKQPAFGDVAYRVPIDGSPVLGPSDAPVTIVEFADFECPFCQRAHATVERLMEKYPGKLRWVMKHNPLPFHPVAVPAAITALEVRRQKGNDAYWQALKQFYAADELNADLLLSVAEHHGLDPKPLLASFETDRIPDEIQADQYLAMDLDAQGTPHFFVNGRRLPGAQPFEVFEELIQQELDKVNKAGLTGDVYETLQASAEPPRGLIKKDVPPPSPDTPVWGPANAPVTIQMFADFECPFCQRVLPTLAEVRARHPGKVKVVWRHLPLEFHARAKPAAIAALEARAQRGPDGFWAMAERLMQLPGIFSSGETSYRLTEKPELPPLTSAFLTAQARAMGLDEARFVAAVDGQKHLPIIEADEELAKALGVSGTPAFFVNGYVLSGAQPVERFERLVRLALDEAKADGQQGSPAPLKQ
jgi:protein-disulfide isomerase